MIIDANHREIVYLVLDEVKDKDITYLRVDRYDGFLFDDFEISKFWALSAQIEVADDFAHEVIESSHDFKYRLFFTNEYGTLICRFYNTLEQIFEDPKNINRVNETMVDEALKSSLITFKQYNSYLKNHGGK